MSTVEVPYPGDPYALVPALEREFGSLLGYRLSGRRMLFTSLAGAWRIRPGGITRPGGHFAGGPAALLDDLCRRADAGPHHWSGCDVVFAFAYELTWLLRNENEVPGAPPPDCAPDGALLGFAGAVDRAVLVDPAAGTVRCAAGDEAVVAAACRAVAPTSGGPARTGPLTRVVADVDRQRYRRQVEQVGEYLHRGDVYQVVVSVPVRVRPHAPVHEYAAEIAARYRDAEYSYYFTLDGTRVFGNCSLPHLTGTGTRIGTRVFAGTRPAARDAAERDRNGTLLREDPKYYAEHVMLVDLERNDLGRLGRPGTVCVDRLCEPIVVGPTTYLATDVSTERTPGHGIGTLVTGNFPRGVVVGAPKIRAQEVLAAVEGQRRGFFAGAVGGYSAAGNTLRSNTIVTCAEQDGDELVLRCGGGVVAESVAEQELAELDLKLRYLR